MAFFKKLRKDNRVLKRRTNRFRVQKKIFLPADITQFVRMVLPQHIAFGTEPGALIQTFLTGKSYTRTAVVTDENTQRCCLPLLPGALQQEKTLVLPPGERHKNLDTCVRIWNFLTALELDRHSVVVVVGGGVPGDMAGFCAATYKRGIDFVLMPTTLLAQVDASVGGKLGIDFQDHKNHIGLFREPAATLICPAFLPTLPERELRSGYAEVVKHGLIADAAFWKRLKKKPWKQQDWLEVVQHSVAIKYGIVQQDPHEKGLRKILNFGHTLGHAIESAALAGGLPLLHGEAIAIGMIGEAFIASQKGILSPHERDEIQHYLFDVFGRHALPEADLVLRFIYQDKKNRGRSIRCAVPKEIGEAVWDVEIDDGDVLAALQHHRSLQM